MDLPYWFSQAINMFDNRNIGMYGFPCVALQSDKLCKPKKLRRTNYWCEILTNALVFKDSFELGSNLYKPLVLLMNPFSITF